MRRSFPLERTQSLIVKLEHGDLDAYRHEVMAQSGKKIAEARAGLLIRLSNALLQIEN